MIARVLHLSAELAGAIIHAAERAYPNECCGLLEGMATAEGWRAFRVHEAANVATDKRRRFLIEPEAQFRLLRALRGTDRSIIGCYHSHPDGRAEPSLTDRASALEADFLWLIAAGSPIGGFALAAHVVAEVGRYDTVRLA